MPFLAKTREVCQAHDKIKVMLIIFSINLYSPGIQAFKSSSKGWQPNFNWSISERIDIKVMLRTPI
jgi:hypothetical protein